MKSLLKGLAIKTRYGHYFNMFLEDSTDLYIHVSSCLCNTAASTHHLFDICATCSGLFWIYLFLIYIPHIIEKLFTKLFMETENNKHYWINKKNKGSTLLYAHQFLILPTSASYNYVFSIDYWRPFFLYICMLVGMAY